MIYLLFLNLVFATDITDNCTDTYCNASIKIGGVEKFAAKTKLKTELLTWINARKDVTTEWGAPDTYTIELTNADAAKTLADNYSTARRVRGLCDHVLNLIISYNLGGAFTTAQIDQLELDFADIKKAITDYRPWKAKPLLEAAVFDNVIFTAQQNTDLANFRDELLAALTESGLPGL